MCALRPIGLVCLVLGHSALLAAEVPAPGRLAALVGTRPVTVADLEARLKLREIDPARASREDWSHALESAINRAVLLAAAQKDGISVKDDEVAASIRARRDGPAAAEYRRQVAALGLSPDQEREWNRERMAIESLLARRLGPKLVVTADAVAGWYEKNKDLLATPEIRTARVITIRAKGESGDAAKRLAALRDRLAAGADFPELARANSQDPWADKGGLLEPMSRGSSGSIFADQVFALKKAGELSPVFATPVGVHVVRLETIQPGRVPTFDEAQGEVRRRLLDELSVQLLTELAADLRRQAVVRIFWNDIPWAPK